MKFTAAVLLLIIFQSPLFSDDMPNWVKHTPKGKNFEYFTGIGSSRESLENAKSNAISDAVAEMSMGNEFIAQVNRSYKRNITESNNKMEIQESLKRDIQINGSSSIIKGLKKEDEYWEISNDKNSKLYQYWILLKIPKKNKTMTKDNLPKGYGFSPVWRSLMIPGWGQFYKGEDKKGWFFLSGETILLSSVLISAHFSSSYNEKAENERDLQNREYYNSKANQFYTASIISAVLAGGLYVYNVFDAVTAKGKKIYALNPKVQPIFVFSNKKNNMRFGIRIKF